jgi:hypothetical protein
MLCQRCRGLLVRVTFSDLREESARLCPATRCVNCGYVEDSVVLANRLRSHTEKRSSPRSVGRTGGVMFIRSHSEEYEPI